MARRDGIGREFAFDIAVDHLIAAMAFDRFCLELHSNKARKAEVLEQMRRSWTTDDTRTAADWTVEAVRLLTLRDRLNRLVDHLHKKHRNGLTPHYAIGVKIRDEALAARVSLSWLSSAQHDEAQLAAMREAVEALQVQAVAVGDLGDSPFQAVASGDWSPQWEAQVVERAGHLAAAAREADRVCSALCDKVGIALPDRTLSRLDVLVDLAHLLLDSYRRQTAFALEPDGVDRLEALEAAVGHLKTYAERQAALSCAYDPLAWRTLDGEEIARRWEGANAAWWPKSAFTRRRIVKDMRAGARGKARHNEGEAKAIVAEVVRRLTHSDPTVREASIGVVTFNSEQQTLIENLLDEARSRRPEIEWAFSRDGVLEPVFVKNLETVQGDERDVILFSITYGPDQTGHVTMNFGPLNRQGGERRLNVAMTRSRSAMVVYSTLSPDKIDLSRSQARAVADLKHFLEYAERGSSALGAAVHGSLGDFESPFEAAVARALRDKGWTVHPQVGVSAYRIDLGIVHPDEPGLYLAGVECDGAMYHSSAVARERDKIRQGVLEGLGWTLLRLWSTDWWINRGKALDALHGALTDYLDADRQRRREVEEARQGAATPVPEDKPSPASIDGALSDDAGGALVVDLQESTVGQVAVADPTSTDGAPFAATEDLSLFGNEEIGGDERYRYRIARLDTEHFLPDPEAFYDETYKSRLSAMIDHVIDTEGPVHEEILVRRIARHHGFQRAGRQIREIVIDLAKHRRGRTREDVGLFFWHKGTVKDRLAPARHVGRENDLRQVEHICAEEIRNLDKELNLGRGSG